MSANAIVGAAAGGALATAVAACGAALAYIASNAWFGVGDVPAMAFWSLPLVLLVYVLLRFPWFGASPNVLRAYIFAVVFGMGAGLVWSLAAGLLLGPWIGAFSFPALACWLFAAVFGLVFGVWLHRRQTWPAAAAIVIVSSAGLAWSFVEGKTPPPTYVLYFKAGATDDDVQRVWEEVLGYRTPSGFALRDGISGVAATGEAGDQQLLTLTFWKSTSEARRNALLDSIVASPLVDHFRPAAPGDPRARRSVEY
jgi:hypothetical protein